MSGRDTRTRTLLAQEAARLMYEEQVDQYFTAKRMAAKRLFGSRARELRFRPADLPSNGEIQAELLRLAERTEGARRTDRLGDMRRCALHVMQQITQFEPRLIGSVATGHIRSGSDIDLHLFSDDPDAPELWVRALGWAYERREVQIRRGGTWCDYLHILVEHDYPIEMTIYSRADLRVRPRSSTDGKPIERLKINDLDALIQREHSGTTPHQHNVHL